MKLLNALLGGLAGSITLTLIHETLRRIDSDAPRMDLLGMEALAKSLSLSKLRNTDVEQLYWWTMAADVVSNGLYYSLAGAGKTDRAFMSGALLGAAAGIGGVTLPEPLGLVEEASNRTNKTKLLTIGLYLTGGLVAAAVINRLNGEDEA